GTRSNEIVSGCAICAAVGSNTWRKRWELAHASAMPFFSVLFRVSFLLLILSLHEFFGFGTVMGCLQLTQRELISVHLEPKTEQIASGRSIAFRPHLMDTAEENAILTDAVVSLDFLGIPAGFQNDAKGVRFDHERDRVVAKGALPGADRPILAGCLLI